MEAALVSAATGALKPVIRKLAALMGDEYKRLKEVRAEVRFLTDELTTMHTFLLKMSEDEEPDEEDKVWMAAVRDLSYDMEDTIDDFMQRVNDKDANPDGFMKKIKLSLEKLGKMKTRRRIGHEIQDLKKQIVEVGERNARYKAREAYSKTINKTVDPRALAIFEDASKLVGIDGPKAELIKLLTEKERQQPKVVSIVGSGGMGKTTLAYQVYQELKGNFKYHAFLSVSRNPDIIEILRTILRKVTKEDCAGINDRDAQQLLLRISSFLVDKRYFVVIDDIWDMKTWDVIKCAFPATNCSGAIITTTRSNDVARSCRSLFNGHIYTMRPLSMVDSRRLFHRRLLKSEEHCPPHLRDVSEQILEKCAGLPLAVIAISGLLANKISTKDQWDEVKNSIGRALERDPSVEGMRKILSLSYFDLPPHLKSCLLYLSIFPEDYMIKQDSLIKAWIAEGFIHDDEKGRYAVHEFGERCFNELVNRSLIQPRETGVYGKVESCGVHDIVLDFIISKSIEENFVTLVGVPNLPIGAQSKVRRLSVQAGNQGNSILPADLVLSHVRSLNVFGDPREIPSLDELRHLRALDFGGCYQLENHHLANIGRLFQLRHLNLRDTGVSKLPKEITDLRCLEMLDLRGTDVHELPSAIANHGKLAHLLIDNHVKFPDGIAKMQALEMLEQVAPLEQSCTFPQELGQLQNLRRLHLDFQDYNETEVNKECMEATVSSVRTLDNLRSLAIVNGDSFLLKTECPTPLSLQILMTWWSRIRSVPNWVSSLVNLQQLRLEVDIFRQEDLLILGSLPALLFLTLEGGEHNHSCPTVIRVSGEVGFRCLKQFCYYIHHEIGDLMFAAGSMPSLEKLDIQFIAYRNVGYQRSKKNVGYRFGIRNLPCLITVKCRVSKGDIFVNIETVKASIKIEASAHPNRPTLLFTE